MTKRRIVLDMRAAYPGMTGVGRYALNLCLSLEAVGAQHLCALVAEPDAEFVASQVRSDLVTIPPGSPAWEELTLPGLLRGMEARIYHTPLFLLPAVRACAYVATVHDAIPVVRPDLTPPGFRAFFAEHLPNAVRRCDAIVTVSQHSRQDLSERLQIPNDRLHVVMDCVSPRFSPVETGRIRSALQHYELKPGYILSVGAFDRRKNLTVLLDAQARLSRKRSLLPTLVFVGAPSGDGFALEAEIASRSLGKRTRVLGRVSEEDLPSLYSGAVALAFPSLYEGFGLPVVEAMACGTPVIASSAASLPEVAGDAAVFFDPTREEDLAQQLERLIDDRSLQENLRTRGFAQAARFSLQSQGERLLRLYGDVGGLAA